MNDILTSLVTGAALGLTGALSPGPLQTLICVQTITHGPREGARVALAPLFTDLPVMALCLAALGFLARQDWLMGLFSLAGGLFVLRMGLGSMRAAPVAAVGEAVPARSWSKGVATNALNPNMWIFWSTVGAPMLLGAAQSSYAAAGGFLAGFYVSLIGTFVVLAYVFARFSRWLAGPGYVWTMRALGALLVLLAFRLLWNGLVLLGIA